MRVVDERVLAILENDSIRSILHVISRGCVPTAELRRRLRLTNITAQLVRRRLCLFGHAVRRPEGELIRGLLISTLAK